MKKMIGLLSVLLISGSALAESTHKLSSLSCGFSNGVTLSTLKQDGEGVFVQSTWGFFQKNFTAQLKKMSAEGETQIQLKNDSGKTEYVIRVKLDPESSKVQTVFGDIYSPGSKKKGEAALTLATVSCNVKLAKVQE